MRVHDFNRVFPHPVEAFWFARVPVAAVIPEMSCRDTVICNRAEKPRIKASIVHIAQIRRAGMSSLTAMPRPRTNISCAILNSRFSIGPLD